MAKTKKTETPEFVEAEVVQDESAALEQQVKQELKKYNLADAKIAELKKKYAGLKVKDLKDKEGFVAVKTALSEVVSIRTGIDKKRLALTGDYRKIVDAINGEAKRLTALIQEVEEPLREEKDRIDRLVKEEKERKAREIQERLDNRVATLKEAGMTFDGSFYVCGDTIAMDVNTIRDMKDADFDFLKAKVEMEAERIRKAAEEEEKRKAAEEAERKRQQEEFEKQQAELRKQQEEFKRQQEEMEKQRRELQEMKEKAEREERERKELLEREKREAEERKIRELINNRGSQLEAQGYAYYPAKSAYVFSNGSGAHKVEQELIKSSSEEHWQEVVKEAIEKKDYLIAEDYKIREAEKQMERERILKEQQEAKAKAEAEEAARLAALPDVEKAELYLKSILETQVPQIETKEISNAVSVFVNHTAQAATELMEELKKFKSGE